MNDIAKYILIPILAGLALAYGLLSYGTKHYQPEPTNQQ